MNEIAKPFGKIFTKDVRIKILGTPEPDTARIAIKEMDLPLSIEEFLTIYRAKVKEVLQHPPLMPGMYLFLFYCNNFKIYCQYRVHILMHSL